MISETPEPETSHIQFSLSDSKSGIAKWMDEMSLREEEEPSELVAKLGAIAIKK